MRLSTPSCLALNRVTFALATFLGLAALTVSPSTARAGSESGIFMQLGVGYGDLSGGKVAVFEQGANIPVEGSGCCVGGGFAFDLRAGFQFLHLIGPEFQFTGQIFGIGNSSGAGGTGMIGGGVRLFPLGIFELAGLPLDIPLDISFGFDIGWTVVGKDFAYTGNYFGWDVALEYRFSETFGLGAKFLQVLPSYRDFVYTDYDDGLGRCLDNTSSHVGPIIPDSQAGTCSGAGPSASFISPQIYAAFNFNLF